MKRFAALGPMLLVGVLLLGCGRDDPMRGRAGSDLPPGPLQPLPSRSAAGIQPCKTLKVAIGTSDHAAGSEYVQLVFTNGGSKPCSVHGYPALTLKDSADRQVGETSESHVTGAAKDVLLAPGETAIADIRFPNSDNFDPGACTRGTTRIEVLIPGATERAWVNDNHAYCPGWTVSAVHRGSF